MGITDTQSYSFVIRDMLHDKVRAHPFFATFFARKSKAFKIQPQQLPYLGTYIVSETMTPESGMDNAGDINFMHELTVGFSVMILNNDPVACEAKLDQAFWTITNTLFRDQYLTNFIDTRNPYQAGSGNPDNTRIESIRRGMRRHVWGTSNFDNETPVGELQYDITCCYRADYPPIIEDDLLEIDVTTGVKPGETQSEMDQRQQIHVKYTSEGVAQRGGAAGGSGTAEGETT